MMSRRFRIVLRLALALLAGASAVAARAALVLDDRGFFATRGLNVLVFNNVYDGLFSDAKIAGVELIHHGVRTVTNGDVRLSPTPGQWDPVPQLVERKVNPADGSIEARMRYAEPAFEFTIRVEARGDGVALSVHLPQPLPGPLIGRAGFNLEFLPAAYFHKAWLMDRRSGIFPLHPTGPMTPDDRTGAPEPQPLATGTTFVAAPDDPARRVTLTSVTGEIALYDGRNTAQNGWFVARTLLPGGQTGRVLEWRLTAHTIPGWTRRPVIGHSQVGYHPAQQKIAVIELDPDDTPQPAARVLQVAADGSLVEKFTAPTVRWGRYLRYDYFTFDFSAQGPTTGTRFQPGEHIPGLNVGGWFDAGDFDLRTQAQYAVVLSLVHTWEAFAPRRDETTIDQSRHYVDLHVPDGVPDILQQIEHGALYLTAQFHAVGHAINGIVEPDLGQYTHLGDAASKTDGLIYRAELKPGESDGRHSGTPDDRWVFTNKSSALNYGSAAGLAAASRALRGWRDALADECRALALRVWDGEHGHAPDLFRHGNTTGGQLEDEEFKAAVELLRTTREPRFARRLEELWPAIAPRFGFNAASAVRALPFMDAAFRAQVAGQVKAYRAQLDGFARQNPYGVPIATGGWAGNGLVMAVATTTYLLHREFPELIDPEPVFRGLHYLHGCHPDSDISFVSGVGTVSKEVAYGSNRADFSFIAGGVVPGVLILQPDFPENKEDWPFLWGENEYVVPMSPSYLFLVHAANDLLHAAR